jgi:hypothetical protein
MIQILSIAPRFCGPPDSANGGYVCGRLAAFVVGPAVVRLQAPPPLDVEMEVRPADDGVDMVHGDTVIAIARPTEVALDAPPPPSYADSEAAARSYAGFRTHFFPTCFVCGPYRKPGDGLRIFPGKLPGTNLVAAPWIPHISLSDVSGKVLREFRWAALDCAGAFACDVPDGTPMMLGEMAAELNGDIQVAERCVVIGWKLGRDGRKHYTGTALYAESGECRGLARATWFEMPPRHPESIDEALLASMSIEPASTANERPASITVIAWILIVTAVVSSIISTLTLSHPIVQEMMNRNPLPLPFQYCLLYAGFLAQLVSGVAMLQAQDWGRILYTVCGVIGVLVGAITAPVTFFIIPSVVFYVVVVVFLFLPKANAYFRGDPAGDAAAGAEPELPAGPGAP